jgi:hypothetical protein
MKPLILRDPPCLNAHSNTSCNKATNLIIATKGNAWETTIGLFLPPFDDHLPTGMWNGSLFEQSVSLGHLVYRLKLNWSLSRRWKVETLLAAPSPIGRRLPTKSHLPKISTLFSHFIHCKSLLFCHSSLLICALPGPSFAHACF